MISHYTALIAPHYSRVGESRVDRNNEELDLKIPKNSPWEERHHRCSTSSVVLVKKQVIQNNLPLQKINWKLKYTSMQRFVWQKILYIYIYIYIYNRVKVACKMMIFTQNDCGQHDIIKKTLILTKGVTVTIHAVIPTNYQKYPLTIILKYANFCQK